MKDRSAASLEQLLREKIEDLDQEMVHLKAVRKTLSKHRRNMLAVLTVDLSEISVVQREARHVVTVDITEETSFDKQVEMITAKISVESLACGKFSDYSKLFIEIPFPIRKTGLHKQPAGEYVRTFYQGSWEDIRFCYGKLFDYAAKEGLVLSGFSYETIINEAVTDRPEDAIVQIEIPAKRM